MSAREPVASVSSSSSHMAKGSPGKKFRERACTRAAQRHLPGRGRFAGKLTTCKLRIIMPGVVRRRERKWKYADRPMTKVLAYKRRSVWLKSNCPPSEPKASESA